MLELRGQLGRIQGPSDAEQAHRTRIALKRLRYLLEPIARRNRRAGGLVRRFKQAQDLLGQHHDMHVLSSAIAALRSGDSRSTFSGLDTGLGTLARLADEAANSAFGRFESTWSTESGHRILARADELGHALQQRPVEPGALRVTEADLAPQPLEVQPPRGPAGSVAIPPLPDEASGNPDESTTDASNEAAYSDV